MTDEKRKPPAHAWKAGQSGNPNGRPAGTGEVARMRDEMAKHVPAVVAKLVEGALSGDIGAARLLMERGYARVRTLRGGLDAWIAAGHDMQMLAASAA